LAMPTLIARLRPDQAVAEAMYVARGYCTSEPIEARMIKAQGMFSLTAIVTLSDKSQVIVQLKDNEIDVTRVSLARGLLGSIVPSTHAVKAKNVFFAYISEYIQGTCWADFKNLSLSEEISIASQVGSHIGDCSLGVSATSAGVVDYHIVPRLSKILEKGNIEDGAIRERLEALLGTIDQLKVLPLALCHIDINARNILLDDGECRDGGEAEGRRIVGLVDWEYAALFPLGMNAWCIQYLSVPTIGGKDRIMDKTQPMLEAFWKALTAKVPEHLHRNLIVAMQMGFVIISTFFEGGTVNTTAMAQFIQRYDWLTRSFEELCAT